MKGSIRQRLKDLERRYRRSVRIVIIWPGDPEPDPEPNTIYIRVVYDDRARGETEWAEK